MQVPLLHFFSSLGFLGDALEDYVGFGGFFKGYHFELGVFLHLDGLWKEGFAYFALKLGEVVGKSDSIYFFFDFTVYPVLQASNVDQLTATFAGAWVYQRIFFRGFFAEAYFARACEDLL